MTQNLKKFLLQSIFTAVFIHLAYFVYGYFKFVGIRNVNIYTEFYRFKFYDDVSISQFFITGFFLLAVLILLIRNHSKINYTAINFIKLGVSLLFIVFLSLTFFISYSFGLNAKLKMELSEKNFNKDKKLINVLNPFLYSHTQYSSEKLFAITNILYPKPYPIIEAKDTIFYDLSDKESFSLQTNYYSIDTLKMLTTNYEKLQNASNSVFDVLGLNSAELQKRFISKTIIKDSTEILFKGREVNPYHDADICMFVRNNTLISPIDDISIKTQQKQNAIERYNLLYNPSKDSLLLGFKKLDTLFKKYNIESGIKPAELTTDAFYFRDHNDEPLNEIRNNFDRNALVEKFKILDRLFDQPNYLHPSIRTIFYAVLFSVWLLGLLIFGSVNLIRRPKKKLELKTLS